MPVGEVINPAGGEALYNIIVGTPAGQEKKFFPNVRKSVGALSNIIVTAF